MYTKIEELLKNAPPHGIGIDYKWEFDFSPVECAEEDILTPSFTATNSYHAMDGGGGYCGVIDFTASGKVHLEQSGKIAFELRDVTVDEEMCSAIMAEYDELAEDEEYYGPSLNDLDDYLFDDIEYCLSEYNNEL